MPIVFTTLLWIQGRVLQYGDVAMCEWSLIDSATLQGGNGCCQEHHSPGSRELVYFRCLIRDVRIPVQDLN